MVLTLLFMSLIHFESILYGVRHMSNFILLYVHIQLSQHYLLKRPFFLHWMILTSLLKINWPEMHVSFSGLSILFHWYVCLSLQLYHTLYCISIVSFEIGKCNSSKVVFLCNIVLATWAHGNYIWIWR